MHHRRIDFPYVDDFCDDEVYVFSTIGQGPKGDKGERGERGEDGKASFPTFADPIEWDGTHGYDENVLVYHEGSTYVSKKPVPTSIDILDTDFWELTNNYNAQIEQLRQELAETQRSVESEAHAREQADIGIGRDITAIRSEFTSTPSSLAACDYLGTIPFLTTAETSVWNHAGSICSNGMHEVMISCPVPQPESNLGTVRFVSVKEDNAVVLPPKTVELGHANSITYVAATNTYYVVPLELMSGGSYTFIRDIWIYNSDFSAKRVIYAPKQPCAISCDPVTGRIFVQLDGGSTTEFWEIVNDEFVHVGDVDIRSQRGGTHVQDIGCYDNMWFANNTVGNFVYGTIEPFEILGNFDISKRCTMTEYYLFGEVDGFDFTPDGHLICSGDYHLAESNMAYGYVHTIFEVIYPTSKVSPIYVTEHFGPINTSHNIDGNFNRLRQWGPFASPQLAIPMSLQIGSIFRAVLSTDISTGAMCFDEFATLVIELNGHSLTCPEIRMDNEARYVGNGNFNVDKLISPSKDILRVSFGGGITLNPSNPSSFFENCATGADIRCGGLSNPNNIKFPGTQVNVGGNHIYMVTDRLLTHAGEVAYRA